MKIERTSRGIIRFYVDEKYLKKYHLEIETFKSQKPFKADIFDSLLDKAAKKYGVKFSKHTMPKNIYVKENIVIFEVVEKSNIIYLENEYIENEKIVKEIWELFRTLPDEKINMGITDVDKKRKLLDEIRSDKGLDYIRKNFMD